MDNYLEIEKNKISTLKKLNKNKEKPEDEIFKDEEIEEKKEEKDMEK